MNNDTFQEMIRCRRVSSPCKTCGGVGGIMYGSTSTWRGGMGGAAMTWDVCNRCWGSGDEERHWTNVRALEADIEKRVAERATNYLTDGCMAHMDSLQPALRSIVDELEKLTKERPRKVPRPRFFRETCSALLRVLKRGMKEPKSDG